MIAVGGSQRIRETGRSVGFRPRLSRTESDHFPRWEIWEIDRNPGTAISRSHADSCGGKNSSHARTSRRIIKLGKNRKWMGKCRVKSEESLTGESGVNI